MDHRLTQLIYFLAAANLCVLSEGLEGTTTVYIYCVKLKPARKVMFLQNQIRSFWAQNFFRENVPTLITQFSDQKNF